MILPSLLDSLSNWKVEDSSLLEYDIVFGK
jgi:hypothetical protein